MVSYLMYECHYTELDGTVLILIVMEDGLVLRIVTEDAE